MMIPTNRPICQPGHAWLLAITLACGSSTATLAAEYPPTQFPYPAGYGRHIQRTMRMPNFGLPVWREILDGAAEDGANTVVLWTPVEPLLIAHANGA